MLFKTTSRITLAIAFGSFLLGTVAVSAAPPLSKPSQPLLPNKVWTPQEREAYEQKVDWLYKAKYGIMFHFVPNLHRHFGAKRKQWTSESWNAWVDAVDVEKVAEQAKEIGAGYFILSIGQGGGFYCAPNPIIEKHWGVEPGQCGSRRDLPMDFYHALKKRNIPLMLYTSTENYLLPGVHSEKAGWFKTRDNKATKGSPEGAAHTLEAIQWYADHYGDKVTGWWLDGLAELVPNYRVDMHKAVLHGNPNAVVTSASHTLSDFLHGHCTADWKRQQKYLPEYGRWDETYQIQWHAFQYLGRSWGERSKARSTESIVNYATNVIKAGGIITFDVGTFDEPKKGAVEGPFLEILEPQLEQLMAIKDAVAKIGQPPAKQAIPEVKKD